MRRPLGAIELRMVAQCGTVIKSGAIPTYHRTWTNEDTERRP
jgi:hypothetical protein